MRPFRELPQDEEGTFLVFFALALAALLGMVALSFDLGRLANTQTELQSFADSVALAAAGELDGGTAAPDAITRARAAAANLITDRQTFGQGGQVLDMNDVTLTFLSALPADDAQPATAVTTSPAAATFVRVDVTPHIVPMNFASALSFLTGSARPQASVAATATAGFTQYACNITPLMFCLPSPTFSATANVGSMVILRSGGNGAAWGPGNFGFIDPTSLGIDPNGPCGAGNLSGRNLYSCLTGAGGALTQCVVTRGGITIEPGQKNGVTEAAFNVRFDIYRATMSGEANQAAYAPAPNVTKGVMPKGGGSCIGGNQDPTGNSIALPRDTCLVNGTCTRFGNGAWDRAEYIRRNHNNIDPAMSATAPKTRYQMYLDEISRANAADPNPSDNIAWPTLPAQDTTGTAPTTTNRWAVKNGAINRVTETGRPTCSSHQSSDPRRRVIIAAGVDCTANPISGRTNNVRAQEFFEIFLTEPVRDDGLSPPNVDIAGEIIGSAGGPGAGSSATGGVFHDVVQLYR